MIRDMLLGESPFDRRHDRTKNIYRITLNLIYFTAAPAPLILSFHLSSLEQLECLFSSLEQLTRRLIRVARVKGDQLKPLPGGFNAFLNN